MFDEPTPGPAPAFTVTELTEHIKSLFDDDPLLQGITVQGEVSNCTQSANGHWYWTIKDEGAGLRCVMWRGIASKQAHLPEEGGAFILRGSVSVYAASGQYQLYVDHLEPVGIGDLYRQFEELKARLEEEGLFADDRKQSLPGFPSRVGIVTSTEAAALADVLRVLGRRWPALEVLVSPTLVQGETAPPQIVTALEAIQRTQVDVVIVTRGGGSIEDLWAFNDERVARAIAACQVPVVTGVGHETDFTIADFVSDVRAATPSAAAEIVTPDGRELAQIVDENRERLCRLARRRIEHEQIAVRRLAHRLTMAAPSRRLADRRTSLEALQRRLPRAMVSRMRLAFADLEGLENRLAALSPQATLERGYAIVLRRNDGLAVTSTDDVGAGQGLEVRVSDGSFGAVVEGQSELFGEEDEK